MPYFYLLATHGQQLHLSGVGGQQTCSLLSLWAYGYYTTTLGRDRSKKKFLPKKQFGKVRKVAICLLVLVGHGGGSPGNSIFFFIGGVKFCLWQGNSCPRMVFPSLSDILSWWESTIRRTSTLRRWRSSLPKDVSGCSWRHES